jgi:hypothetical protein
LKKRTWFRWELSKVTLRLRVVNFVVDENSRRSVELIKCWSTKNLPIVVMMVRVKRRAFEKVQE